MQNIFEQLLNYGVDKAEIMERFVDDEDFYLECVNDFFITTNLDELKNLLANKDYKQAFDYVHTIKGVAGNLGLKNLFSVISVLVEALRVQNYDNINTQFADLQNEYEKVKTIAVK